MHTAAPAAPSASGARVAGYAFALGAGVLWGTTGVLSTALADLGSSVTAIGFWRVFLAALGFLAYGLVRRDLFRVDRAGLLLVGLGGGVLVAVFEIGYQYAIRGVGVAGAATLLYVAPILVAVFARLILREALTPLRLFLAVAVLVGIWMTVTGHAGGGEGPGLGGVVFAAGIVGGLASALSYTGTTILARWAVPRYGALRVLFLQLAGGSLVLGLGLPLSGQPIEPAGSIAGWSYIAMLGIGSVLLANLAFFAAVRRIEAAPTAVAASIEPVVSALLALVLLGQALTAAGWLGLCLVVGGVAAGYLSETARKPVHSADPVKPLLPA